MAEEEVKKPEQKSEETTEKKADSNRVMFFGILAAILVLNGLIAFMLFQVTRPKSQKEIVSEQKADSLKMAESKSTVMGATTGDAPLEVVVNIAGTEGSRFLKVALVFEYDNQDKALGEELLRRYPKFKNILIDQLSQMTLMELTEPTAREKIRKEFLKRINRTLPLKGGKVTDVLLDQFIIQ